MLPVGQSLNSQEIWIQATLRKILRFNADKHIDLPGLDTPEHPISIQNTIKMENGASHLTPIAASMLQSQVQPI